jgi:hypothetical protein
MTRWQQRAVIAAAFGIYAAISAFGIWLGTRTLTGELPHLGILIAFWVAVEIVGRLTSARGASSGAARQDD